MQILTAIRFQIALVALLVVGSLSALVFNVFTAVVPRERELEIREQLRDASRQMAAAAAAQASLLESRGNNRDEVDRALATISTRCLASFPNVDGGFYLGGRADRFSGFSAGGDRQQRPAAPLRNEPPPLETPFIRIQAQQSLMLGQGEYLLNIRDVGPSRVAVLTEPVGSVRPAPLATWLMFRLIDPKRLGTQVRRYQLSTGLALAALGTAVVLAFNLGRLIRRQNTDRDRLQAELRRAEHLAALGTLLAGVAHEVRNPLAAIRSTVQLWQRMPDSQRSPNSLTAVVQAVDRINEIVSELLHFSRSDGNTREMLDVHQLLVETLDLVAAQAADQAVTIDRCFDATPSRAEASGQALRKVFLNLATNALQAMRTGGELRVRTETARGQIVITFADSGPGIPAENRGRLFEPFFTTRPTGTGLGLAICREIVAQHGGQIELMPGTGQGATFRVTLPRPERLI